jgi:hypothetical protein
MTVPLEIPIISCIMQEHCSDGLISKEVLENQYCINTDSSGPSFSI